MGPKRSKAAASSSKLIAAGQPEPSRPTRTSGRKRRHSDADSIASDATSSVVGEVHSQPKRRKRKAAAEEVIVEEDEHQVTEVHEAPPNPLHIGKAELHLDTEAIDVSQAASSQKHVHFGSDTENVDPEHSTATNITPHPRTKMTIKRRTLSPSVGSETKRVKVSRTSLPASLADDPTVDPFKLITELKFAPLSTVLQKAISRLTQSRKSLQLYDGAADEVDADMEEEEADILVLDEEEEIAYPQLPTPSSTPLEITRRITTDESTETSLRTARRIEHEERQRFHDAILALEREAEDAKANLRILNIEAQSIGFDGEDAKAVFQSIRESSVRAREFLELELPGTVPEDASTQDVLDILIANVQEFAGRLRVAHQELLEKGTLNADLGNQVHTLVDLLAQKELKNQQLLDRSTIAEETVAKQAIEIGELQNSLADAENERDLRQQDLDIKVEKVDTLEGEKVQLEESLARLTKSLEDYRAEETRLTELITKMEEEHRETVGRMNMERETTVRELENNLDAEAERRNEFEALAAERQTRITELEEELESVQRDHDELLKERDQLQIDYDEEVKEHEATGAALGDRETEIKELEIRIEGVEADAEKLEEQLANLRQQNETERQQREAAEQELDEKAEQIEDLEAKLRERGKEANELRLKAHEMQTKSQQRITELEEQMSERDAQFQADMAEEVRRREEAEELAGTREVGEQALAERLAEVEAEMKLLLEEKDVRIEELEEQLAERDAEITALQAAAREAEERYQSEILIRDERNAELDGAILILRTTIEKHETHIAELQQQAIDVAALHASETEDRDTAIADLNHRVAQLEAAKRALEKEKDSLEKRVEAEATQMLEATNDFQDQIDDLRQQLLEKQRAVSNAVDKAKEAEALAAKTMDTQRTQVRELELEIEEKDEIITERERTIDDLNQKFKEYVRRSMEVASEMRREVVAVQEVVVQEESGLRAEGEALLEELEAANVPRTEPVRERKSVTRKVVKRGRAVKDSGIGLEESMLLE